MKRGFWRTLGLAALTALIAGGIVFVVGALLFASNFWSIMEGPPSSKQLVGTIGLSLETLFPLTFLPVSGGISFLLARLMIRPFAGRFDRGTWLRTSWTAVALLTITSCVTWAVMISGQIAESGRYAAQQARIENLKRQRVHVESVRFAQTASDLVVTPTVAGALPGRYRALVTVREEFVNPADVASDTLEFLDPQERDRARLVIPMARVISGLRRAIFVPGATDKDLEHNYVDSVKVLVTCSLRLIRSDSNLEAGVPADDPSRTTAATCEGKLDTPWSHPNRVRKFQGDRP
jgi:hypothetical protein